MMQNIPLFGVGVRSISDIVTRQRRVNCLYDIRKDQDRTSIVLLGTPGSSVWITITDAPIRGWHVANSLLYVCAASNLYAVTVSGIATLVASGISENGPVSIADNGVQLLIVTGGLGYVYQLQASTLSVITDPFFPVGATSCVFLNGRFIVNSPGTRQFYVSGILDGLNWTYLGSSAIVGSKENSSDLLVRVSNLNGTLVLYGQQSIEFWQDVGTSPLPYQRINGATQSWGLAAPLSNVDVGNTEFFLGYAPNGGISVIRLDGYNPEPVSDSDLDTLFSSFSTVEDAVALTYTAYGHPIYQITFPTENRSFAYDVKTGIWHEAQTGVAEQGRHFAQYGITYGGRNYVSDVSSRTIYFLDTEVYTDYGGLIKRQVATRHIRNQGNELAISELFLDFETGVGVAPPGSPVGQIAYTTPGTYTFTVPDGVTSICAVLVGGGGSSADNTSGPVAGNPGGDSEISGVITAGGGGGAAAFSGSFSISGAGGTGTALVPGVIGGGNGGTPQNASASQSIGGGGAGGYSGNGGSSGGTGAGGGGGGGTSWSDSSIPVSSVAGGGGGVGLLGQGSSGQAGTATQATAGGGGGSGGAAGVSTGTPPYDGNNGGLYGGGGGGNQYNSAGGGGGGGLRYINNYAVTPGSTLTVIVGAGGAAPGGKGGAGANGAVRIIWGPGRSFPSTLTADLPTQDASTVEENPKVSLRISRDGGRTFGNERWVPLGRVGQYDARVILRRLGSARDFVVQITMTDPVKFVLASGSVSLESGDA
jgi:hypothetical protein